MKIKQGLFLLFCTLFSLSLSAQDIHFTMYDRSPLTLNPAFTGAFEGTFRIGGIYRDQWQGLYRTPAIYIDAPILPGIGKNDWIGVGGTFYSDKAGTIAELTNSGFFFSGSYHLSLDKDRKNVLTLGLQGGTAQRSIRLNNAQFGDQLENVIAGNDPVTQETIAGNQNQGQNNNNNNNDPDGESSAFDFMGGILFKSQLNDNTLLTLGVGGFHILGPEYGINNPQEQLDTRINAHARADFDLTDKWKLSPQVAYQTIAGSEDIAPQVWAGYLINPEKLIRINFGLGYRLQDAAQFMVGMDYDAFSVAFAFDLNVSDATDYTNGVGGFEIAASYIGKIFSRLEPDTKIFCPRF